MSYTIVKKKPDTKDLEHIKIGSGNCSITQGITIKTGDSIRQVPILTNISGDDTPIATTQNLSDQVISLIKSNYNSIKSKMYRDLESATNGWNDEKIKEVIHNIDLVVYDPSFATMSEADCEKDYLNSVVVSDTITTTDDDIDDNSKQIVVQFSAPGYLTKTRGIDADYYKTGDIIVTGRVLDNNNQPVPNAKILIKEINASTLSNNAGEYVLKAKAEGKEPYSTSLDVTLQKIEFEITNEKLGSYKEESPFGVVSDGFTTLKLKVKAIGVEPRTVIVKQPALGNFVGHTMLNLALVMDEDGTGEMEYVPPAYLTSDQLTKHLTLKSDASTQNGIAPMLWVAEVPVTITYEDEEGNPGSYTFTIYVTRPPVMLIHGFTGDETTWAKLANYMRVRKYETVVREYYKGPVDESTIPRQSEKLAKYIKEVHEAYTKNGFLQNRVDIVAHSMGGLISRYYISNMAKYGKKAGIWIPYNVKLSRDKLKEQRFKNPVILNDVRKLIMVGTPNHGASFVDELLGFVSALYEGYHLIANAQLNSNSKFIKDLNKGESEGRHLDNNVQYAVIYGIRKRSAFYPPDAWLHTWGTSQKEFANDDGVVSISSAKLNGVKDYPFPKEWYAIHGYIHSASPIVQNPFPEDEPLTESTNVFEKITELLQKDIPRAPLKNSYSKIIRSRGEVYFKYLPTETWKPINKIIQPDNAIKLTNNWCRIKTGEGSATLGFFLDGHQWGKLHIMPNTIVYYEYASPEFVKVYMQKGKSRFKSRKQGGGGFEVVMGDKGEKWYEFNPKAKVRDINTDFIIDVNENISMQSINGKLSIIIPNEKIEESIIKEISSKEGVSLDNNGIVKDYPLPDNGWWLSIDTSYVNDEILNNVIEKNNNVIEKVGKIDSSKNVDIDKKTLNKLPIINFEVSTVSGGPFETPVWVKFYPIGTYDPDGKIVKFEMDMDGDGIFDVKEKSLKGSSYEFTVPGEYIAIVRVTDDKGGVTTKSKTFSIYGEKLKSPEIDNNKPNKKNEQKTSDFEKASSNNEKTINNSNLLIKDITKHKPLTTTRMYHPDSTITSGRWSTAVNIRESSNFDKFTTKYMEPGISWTNGMFTHPGNAPTEMIYYHDESKRFLSGYVSILDCIDYCGSSGDCEFIIMGDGKQLWSSGVVHHHDRPVHFVVSLKGIKELRLITNSGGDDLTEDWGCWMEMKVSKKAKKSSSAQAIKDDNILINGSFEEGGTVDSYKTLRKGNKIPGWTVIKATVDLNGNYFKAQDGQNSIDLNGSPGVGGIQQRFFTKKGKKYLLSFYLAGNPEGGPKIKKLLVSFGDQTRELEFDITGKSKENMGWEYHELVFKAKQRATILKFESNQKSGPENCGPIIDNVKLVPYKRSKHHKVSNDNTSLSLFGLKYGILAGGSYYFVKDDDINRMTDYNTSLYQLTSAGNTIGMYFGLMSQMRIWRILLRPEFVFNFNKIEYNIINKSDASKNTIGNQWFGYLDIPVLLGYKSGDLRFMAGPVWHLLAGNLSGGRKGTSEFTRKLKRFTIGFQVGIGFDAGNFGFDLRYETNCRFLGDGLKIKSSGKKTYFAETPGRIFLTINYLLN